MMWLLTASPAMAQEAPAPGGVQAADELLILEALGEARAPRGETRTLESRKLEVDNSALCPANEMPLAEMPGARHAFSIARTGVVTVNRDAEEPLLQFDLGSAPGESTPREGFVRIDLVKKSGAKQTACARVKNGAVYRFPTALDASQEDHLVVRLYDVPRDEAEKERFLTLRQGREKALFTQKIADGERAELRKKLKLEERIIKVAKALENVPPPKDGAFALNQAIEDTHAELERAQADCPRADKKDEAARLLVDLCDEAKSIQASLKGLRQKLINHENTPRDAANLQRRHERLKEVVSTAALLATSAPPPGTDGQEHCKRVEALIWLRDDAAARLVVQSELPLVHPGRIIHARYDAGNTRETLPPDELLAVLLHRVPTEVQLGTGILTRTVAQQQTLASLLESAFTLTVPLLKKAGTLGVLPRSTAKASWKDLNPDDPQGLKLDPRYPTLVCHQTGELKYTVDPGAAPIAALGTRVAYKGRLKDGKATELFVCNKTPCETKEDHEFLRTRVTLEPEQASVFPVLVELSATGALGRGLSFGSPHYVPIGGPTGPQRVYELRSEYEAQEAFSLSLLFGYRVSRRWALALGPSVLVGPSGGTFSQFNLRGALEMTRGAYFTFGPSMRLVQTATQETRLGARVAVENKDDPKVPTPLGLEYRPRFGLSLGISVDVSVLSEAGKGLLKAVGVTQ